MPQHETLVKEITKENQQGNPVVECLQRELANAFLLYVNYKHYHWQTFGPMFRDLHLMFDEFAKEVLHTIDEMAERLRMIGQDPIFRMNEMQGRASVQMASADKSSMREMIEEADANLMVVIKGMREGARAADENDDPGSVDMFSKFVQIHEKHEWFLREILKKGDGFVR